MQYKDGKQFYLGYGIGPNAKPAIQLVRTWKTREKRHFQVITVQEFETFEDARVFEAEFNQYLMPGILELDELAIEVAQLNNYATEWETL